MAELENEINSGYLDETAGQLLKGFKVNKLGEYVRVSLPDGWVGVNSYIGWIDRNPFKVTAVYVEKKLFVKAYCPRVNDYASSAYRALKELSELPLTNSVLSPLGMSNGIIFFRLGKVLERKFYEECFKLEEHRLIASILDGYRLEGLARRDKVDIVEVDGNRFIADPFDDSVNSIFDFSRK